MVLDRSTAAFLQGMDHRAVLADEAILQRVAIGFPPQQSLEVAIVFGQIPGAGEFAQGRRNSSSRL